MTVTEAVAALAAINGTDPERAHSAADEILRLLAPSDVRAAYDDLVARCDWWAAA